MKCDHYLQILDSYLDNELNSSECSAFEHHSTVCGTCRTRLEDRRKLIDVFSAARCEEWSFDITDSVMATIRKMPSAGSISPLRFPIIVAVASTLLVFLLLMIFGAGSVVTGIPPLEIFKTIVSMVEMPPAVQNNIHELRTIFATLISVSKSLFLLIWSMFRSTVLHSPLILIPAIGFLAGIVVLVWFRMRFNRGRIML